MLSVRVQTRSTWRESPPVLARQDCTICRGTGWILVPVRGASGARRCACGVLDRLLQLKEFACIPQRYEHCSLDNFTPVTCSQARALAQAQGFVERYPKVSRGLFFAGGPGAGKSHLAVGIVRELLQRFHDDVRFIDCETLAHAATVGSGGYEVHWARLAKVELLVLDNFALGVGNKPIGPIQELIQGRLNRNRLTIYIGALLPRGDALRTMPAVPFQLLMQIMKSVRVVTVNGPDVRQQDQRRAGLF